MIKKECEKIAGKYADKLEIPQKGIDADMTIPCFSMGNPAENAKIIAKSMKPSGIIKEVKAEGPYVNFYANWEKISPEIIMKIIKGPLIEKNEKNKIMIEYSSPNTNKPLHVGHLRNDSIGMAMAKIMESIGNTVIKAILYNDRGVHICKSMLAYKNWGEDKEPDKKSDHFVGDWYVKFEKSSDDEMKEELHEMLKKWEEGDEETRNLWKKMNDWVLKGMEQTYKRFGSEFDLVYKESEHYKKGLSIIKKGKEDGVFIDDEKGITAELKDGTKKIVMRKDGTSIYITNDLGLTKEKFNNRNLDKSIWVVATEQNTYFKQLFEIFEKLGFEWSNKCFHLAYGLVNLPSGRMKTREGNVVDADNLMDKIKELVKKNYEMEDDDAEKVSLAAIKYFMLKFDSIKDITFNIGNSIKLEGNTGPYIQYTYARINSILKKSGGIKDVPKISKYSEDEKNLVKKMYIFNEIVLKASKEMKPSILCNYLFELSSEFNSYYHAKKIIGDKNEESLLWLIKALKLIIAKGLELLNIKTLEKM